MLLVGLLLGATAHAQSPDGGLPEVAPPAVTSIAAGSIVWREERGASRLEAGLVSLARSADGSAWLLGLEDGSLWRSIDGARTWARVLRAPADREELDDERVLLEGEVLVDEDLQAEEESSDSTEDRNAADETEATVGEEGSVDASGAPRETQDRASADMDRVGADPLLTGEDGTRAAVVWFDPADASRALAGRSDGIWLSEDGGRAWRRVDSGADAWRFLSVPSLGVVVAGTSAGVRVSPDGGARWFDTVDVTDGLRVDALTTFDGAILAGTRGGLYRSTDGLRWSRLPLSGAVVAILPDPGWDGGLWVGTPGGVLRSDDGGKTFSRLGRQVLAGLRGLAALPGQGHLLAWGEDGVWESLDGGVTWAPLFRGLRDPDIRDVVVVGEQPVAVGARSVWRLGAGKGDEAELRANLLTPDDQALLGAMIDTATNREGIRLSTLRPAALSARRWLPFLSVDVQHGDARGRSAGFLDTDEARLGYWYAGAVACFGGCSAGALYDLADAVDEYAGVVDLAGLETMGVDELATAADDLYSLDGEVLAEGSEAFAATNSAQKIRKYRQQVADQVVGAWSSLQRLQSTAPPPSLAGQVTRLLDLAEAQARLDLYTDGAFTRARITESKP